MGENNEEKVYEIALKHAVLNAYKHEGKADLKAVVGKVIAELPSIRNSLKTLMPIIQKAVEDANKMSTQEQRAFLEEKYPELLSEERRKEEEKTLPPLPNAVEGKVVTRFAPNPDFVIHIGNSRVAILSHEYARMYKGKMILRFEDTDPRTKKPMIEAYNLIKEDLRWLGIKWDEEYIQSLRMPIYYEIAKKLIELGGAYVDTVNIKGAKTDEDEEEQTKAFIPPPAREADPSVNLELFEKMINGDFGEGEAVLRVKTGLDLPDKSLVDWVAFRIIDTDVHPHPITGSRYVAWPTYNFAVAVDDHLLGITHIIRGKEHLSNTYKQRYIYDYFEWTMPETIHVGRLKLEGFIMSKSVIKKILMDKPFHYQGPEDPRFGTIAALRKRGIKPEAIRRIMVNVGIKSTDASISYANLAAENRKIIEPISPRVSFVWSPVRLKIKNLPSCIKATLPFHPDNPALGSRSYELCENDEVAITMDDYKLSNGKIIRLMETANFLLSKDYLEFHSHGLEKAKELGAPIIHWVKTAESEEAVLYKPEGDELILVKGLLEKKFIDVIEKHDTFQLLRYGFAKLETITPVATLIYIHE
jgi:glutamyl-tRNA synthetase